MLECRLLVLINQISHRALKNVFSFSAIKIQRVYFTYKHGIFSSPILYLKDICPPSSKQWKKDMRFGTWKVTSLCRVGATKSVVGELEKYKLDLVGVQEVR
jgi:hypothetical protein